MFVPSVPRTLADLLRDGCEDLGRWHPVGDLGGDAAQRRLLVGEPSEFVAAFLELGAALGVRDRGADELGEPGHALFGVGRENARAAPRWRSRPTAAPRPRSALRPTTGIPSGGRRRRTRRGLGCSRRSEPGGLVRKATATATGGSGFQRLPTGSSARWAPTLATRVVAPSGSRRTMTVPSAPRTLLASSATAANTSAGGSPRATRVATRRRAACSSAIRRSSSRLSSSWARPSAFAIAVPTSSVKPAMRCSVSAGKRSRRVPTAIAPHRCPSTMIGVATADRIPSRRTASP